MQTDRILDHDFLKTKQAFIGHPGTSSASAAHGKHGIETTIVEIAVSESFLGIQHLSFAQGAEDDHRQTERLPVVWIVIQNDEDLVHGTAQLALPDQFFDGVLQSRRGDKFTSRAKWIWYQAKAVWRKFGSWGSVLICLFGAYLLLGIGAAGHPPKIPSRLTVGVVLGMTGVGERHGVLDGYEPVKPFGFMRNRGFSVQDIKISNPSEDISRKEASGKEALVSFSTSRSLLKICHFTLPNNLLGSWWNQARGRLHKRFIGFLVRWNSQFVVSHQRETARPYRDDLCWRSPFIRGPKTELSGYRGINAYNDPRALRVDYSSKLAFHNARLTLYMRNALLRGLCRFSGLFGLFGDGQQSQDNGPCCRPVWPSKEAVPTWSVPFGLLYVFLGMMFVRFSGNSTFVRVCGYLCALAGGAFILTGYEDCQCKDQSEYPQIFQHDPVIVPQKYLDMLQLLGYTNSSEASMANVLPKDKQIAAISALAEGSSIRSIERMTGVHRDTIMRLGVKIGQGCTALMDAKMRDLSCTRLELDEIWGFVGKKDKNVRLDEPRPVGNVWTFCAIDAETKLVPAFRVGDRDIATAKAFVSDIASRMRTRVQISTDGLRAYVEAIESAFGSEVDFAQIVKTYGHEVVTDNRRYSAPEFVSSEKKVITGNPNERLISTSYVERLNATTRLHMRRLTRLTLAFSKKRENFEAAVGLHFAYYNFVKRHNTLRCTPAMAAGIERGFWSVGDLVEAAA